MISEREDELVKVIEAMDATRTRLAQRETDVAALREKVTAEEAEVSVKVAELAKEMAVHEGGRGAVASQVPRDLLRRYELVQKRRGLALVPVVEGSCKGCFMSLPPQLSNIIARGTSIETCPSCQRLLYRPEMMDDAPVQSSAEPAK
jgi:hypothetical protein